GAAEAAGLKPHGLYGSWEVQALFSIAQGDNRLRGGGVPVSEQARLAVRDPETGAALPDGASGELWIDAPSRFIEYLDNPSATARAIDADGVFRTGDLAHLADAVSSTRRGSATRCGLADSWSAPRKSRPLFKGNLASPACRSLPPPV